MRAVRFISALLFFWQPIKIKWCLEIMKKNLALLLLLTVSTMAWGQSLAYKTLLKGVYEKDFPVVNPQDLEGMPDAVLLDTREIEEFEISHLKGANWVGYDTFTMDSVNGISKEQPIVVYCSIGARSQDIGKKLKKAGFKNVYNLYGGVFHWVNEGFPVYNKEGETSKVHGYSRTWGIWLNRGEKVY